MTIDELEKLIKRAEDVQGKQVNISRYVNGRWSVTISGCPDNRDIYMGTLDQCVTSLKKWATPPKPKTLTFTLDTEYCEGVMRVFDANGCYRFGLEGQFEKALKQALAPYQEQP